MSEPEPIPHPEPVAPVAVPTSAPPASSKAFFGFLAAWDAVLATLVLALAFLLASSVARNADLWQHLAAGRLIAHGEYSFGRDPFGFAEPERYWANANWGFDYLTYQLYARFGDRALVMVKAFWVVAIVAVVIAAARRRGQLLLLPVVCAGLAVLVAGPNLFLKPALDSMAGVVLTLAILFAADPKRWIFLFPILFAAWANLDEWFILGPLLLALYTVGEVVRGRGKIAGRALAVGLIACFINPHHYHIWQLPGELASADIHEFLAPMRDFKADLRGLLDDGTLSLTIATGLVPQTVAFLILLPLTLLLMALNYRRVAIGHILILLALLGLTIPWGRGLPMLGFALAMLAIHYGSLAADGPARPELPLHKVKALRTARLGGRLITSVALAGLLFAAWPGWLHPDWDNPQTVRRVAWGIEPDAGLVKAAETVGKWRAEGKLGDANCLTFAPDLACLCAWYAPGQRQYFDYRYTFNSGLAEEFAAARLALIVAARGPNTPKLREVELGDFLGKYRVAVLAFTAAAKLSNSYNFQRLLRKQAGGSAVWEFLRPDGRACFLGWNGQKALTEAQYRALQYDPVHEAYAREEPVPVPAESNGGKGTFWEEYFQNPRRPVPHADEASALLDYHQFQMETLSNNFRLARGISAFFSGGIVGNALKVTPVIVPTTAQTRAVSLLAVRAARTAVAEDPDAPEGHYYLARAYAPDDGGFETTETYREWVVNTEFHRALARTTPQEQAAQRTFGCYDAALRLYKHHFDRGQYDLAYVAYRQVLEYFLVNPPSFLASNEDRVEFFKKLQAEKWPIGGGQFLEPKAFLEKVADAFENAAARYTNPIDRARIAVQRQQNQNSFGLVLEALKILREADPQQMSPQQALQGQLLYVDLNFEAGRLEEAAVTLADLQKNSAIVKDYGMPLAERSIRAKFAAGNIAEAAAEKEDLVRQQWDADQSRMMKLPAAPPEAWAVFLAVTEPPPASWPLRLPRSTLMQAIDVQRRQGIFEAENLAQIGLMQLEAGRNAEARRLFEKSLKPSGFPVGFPSRAVVAAYLNAMESAK